MASRSKRQRTPSARLEDAFEEVTARRTPKVASVYRLLKPSDLKPSLVSRAVFVLWPAEENEDGGVPSAQWYHARVDSCNVSKKTGTLFYDETDELEENADLADLIAQGHLAIKEPRPLGHKLKRDEVAIDAPYTGRPLEERLARPRQGAQVGDEVLPLSDDESEEEAIEDDDPDFDLDGEADASAGKRKRDTEVASSSSEGDEDEAEEGSGSDADEAPLSARAAKLKARVHRDAEDDEETVAAERLLHQARSSSGTSASAPRRQASSSFYGSSGGKSIASPTEADAAVQEKVRQGIQAALELAVEEARERGEEPDDKAPELVARQVEAALFAQHGGTTKDYKAKFRTLQFNLKDPANPDLRGDVLAGRLTPDRLVTLSPTELANKELAEYRKRKEEEALKMAVLDAEAAAKFSTAAALESTRERGGDGTAAAGRPGSSTAVEADKTGGPAKGVGEELAGTGPLIAEQQEFAANEEGVGLPETSEPIPQPSSTPPTSPTAQQHRLQWDQIKASAMHSVEADSLQAKEDEYTAWQGEQQEEEQELEGAPSVPKPDNDDSHLPELQHLFAYASPSTDLGPRPRVWESQLELPGEGAVLVSLDRLAGLSDPALLLGDQNIEIRGRVALEKLEEFLLDLRHSRHRAAALAVARLGPRPTERERTLWTQLLALYADRDRAGIAGPGPGVEAYLLADGDLAKRVLAAAHQEVAGPRPLLQPGGSLQQDEALVLLIHKKDWRPAPGAVTPLIRGRSSGFVQSSVPTMTTMQQQPTVVVPPTTSYSAPQPAATSAPSAGVALPAGIDWAALSALAKTIGTGPGGGAVEPVQAAPKRASRWDASGPAAGAAVAGWNDRPPAQYGIQALAHQDAMGPAQAPAGPMRRAAPPSSSGAALYGGRVSHEEQRYAGGPAHDAPPYDGPQSAYAHQSRGYEGRGWQQQQPWQGRGDYHHGGSRGRGRSVSRGGWGSPQGGRGRGGPRWDQGTSQPRERDWQ